MQVFVHSCCDRWLWVLTIMLNIQPIYGFASGDPLRFKRAAGHKDLFYIEEKDVEFKEVRDFDCMLSKI